MLGLGASIAIPTVLSGGFANTKSIELDGTGDHVTTYPDNSDTLKEILSGSPTAGKGFAISSWIYHDWDATTGYWGCDDSTSTGITVRLGNTNFFGVFRQPHIAIRHSQIYQNVSINLSQLYTDGSPFWTHIVLVYEVDDSGSEAASTAKVYVNGSLDVSTQAAMATYSVLQTGAPSGSGTFTMANTGFVIGGWSTQASGDVSMDAGLIDDFAIFNTKLTLSEVQEIYNSGAPADLTQHSKAGNLVNYYRFEDDVTDTQGNQNGTAQGNPTFSTNVPT